METIDRIDWHTDDIPESLPAEKAAIHIGFYLTWVIENKMISEEHAKGSQEVISRIKNKEITALEFLVNNCDGKFSESDLNQEGLAFTLGYYEDDYLDDFDTLFGDSVEHFYELEDSWPNYEKIKKVIDKRFAEWKSRRSRR
ncbi:MAG: hypothetical protein K0R65_2503 [Crocinitomicaceae bacterium]|jgi:hypothetical protein|nr:hypothetical protein [Crocinitomicaceae bacterium]